MYIKGEITELKKQMDIERDMLNGNLNRMMVCDDIIELNNMFLYSIRRINNIYEMKKITFINDYVKNENKGVIL